MLGRAQRLHLVLSEPSTCVAARASALVVLCAIIVSTLSLMLASLPRFNDAPPPPAGGDDDGAKPAEPEPRSVFDVLDALCVAFFTVEVRFVVLLLVLVVVVPFPNR